MVIIEKAEGGEKAIRGKRGEELKIDRVKRRGRFKVRGRCSLRSSLGAVRGRITPRCDRLGRHHEDKIDDKLQAARSE